MIETPEQFETHLGIDKRYLGDGVYDVSDKEVLFLDNCEGDISQLERHWEKIKEFINKYPNWCFATPYQVGCSFLVSEKPSKIHGRYIKGYGFNHGSGNLITNCPSKILILGEDD